jgi:hypothetical protein
MKNELSIGDKVRCKRTGATGRILGFKKPEEIGLSPQMPMAVLVETEKGKKGFIREINALERL